jgi:hypothetical protein
MSKLMLFFFCCCAMVNTTAQQTLNSRRNYFRPGDVIIKQQVEFKDPGASGKDITWDFSHVNTINEKYQLVYYNTIKGDTTHVTGLEHETRYRYLLRMDTLWLTGYENRTTRMDYQQPEALLRFPLHYGDTLGVAFAGTGLYCQKIDLAAKGYTKASVDATGKLITPEGDTLKNVLRVLRTKEFTDIGTDSANIGTNMRMETYQWYARGMRYPVFETVKTYTLRNDSALDNFSTSFYFSTIKREQLQEDLANANLKDDTVNPVDNLINCNTYPNPVATDVTVNYELSVDARVSFLICDVSGRPWANVPARALTAGVQQQRISMSGLHAGDYGLYIKVNDKVYKRTIIKL